VNVGVSSVVNFLGVDDAPVSQLGIRTGMTISDYARNITLILSNRPDVTPVSTFWFGYFGSMDANRWSQSLVDSFSGFDSACAFSWQSVVVPAYGTVNLVFIIQSIPKSDPPVLDMSSTSLPASVHHTSSITLIGTATSQVFETNIALVGVVDNDLANRRSVWGSSIVSGSLFSISVPAETIGGGYHTFTVYAVDSTGAVSEGLSFNITVIAPTPRWGTTRPPSRTPTQASGGISYMPTPLGNEEFTEAYSRKRFRVKRIFRFAYIIPLRVN
jgi:hypothetical protein